MALRYLARKVGVPALRRASGSRLAQPAGTPRRLSSSSHQGGHDNGAGKPMTDADVARLKAEFTAKCEHAIEAWKKEEANRRFLFKSCATGVGVALLAVCYTAYTERERGKHFRKMLLE